MARRQRRRAGQKRGFSILELAVVLATIGVLASIAIPQLQRSLNRAHTMEAIQTANTIERLMVDYYNAHGQYPSVAGAQNPPQPLTAGKAPWKDGQPGWTDIGFVGDGTTYFYRYEFIPNFDATLGRTTQMTIHAWTQFKDEAAQDEFFIQLNDGERVGDIEIGE